MNKLIELMHALSMLIISIGMGEFFIFLTVALIKDHWL